MDVNHPDFNATLKALEEAAINARGHVMHRVASFEMTMNLYLTQYFSSDENKRTEMLCVLWCTNRITFNSKVDIFQEIVIERNNEFVKSNPKYKTDLKRILEVRNHFAHLVIDITETGMQKKGVVSLAKWEKDKVRLKNYSYKEVNDFVEMVYHYDSAVGKLLDVGENK